MKENPPWWPAYTGEKDEWKRYSHPNRMPLPDMPQDIPLPYDRSNANRNYTQLIGQAGAAMMRMGMDFGEACGNVVPHFASEIEIGLANQGFAFDHFWPQMLAFTGDRPQPLRGLIHANTPKTLAAGDGVASVVYLAIDGQIWSPIVELTIWRDGEVVFHRLVPSRFVQKFDDPLFKSLVWMTKTIKFT